MGVMSERKADAAVVGEATVTHEQRTALWVGAFFDEMVRWGMRDVVVSPGSRSTALAMAAFELSRRRSDDLHLYVDVDERGAAFFALGMAKASGRPVACICTSGTALANYYPAVIEAETSRVPLVVLSGDRPPHLQGLGAPQTTDQLKAYGDHVRAFRAMPLPGADERDLAFVRQAAREACLAALGSVACFGADRAAEAHAGVSAAEGAGADVQVASRGCERMAGPVHVNFPFDEPLKPDFPGADALVGDVFAASRRTGVVHASGQDGQDGADAEGRSLRRAACHAKPTSGRPVLLSGRTVLDGTALRQIKRVLEGRRALVLAGEGTCSTLAEAHEVVAWAHALELPILADPLSGLRSVDAPEVIDNYDNVARRDDCPVPEVVIRFGRYPVSKHATIMAARAATSIVVDVAQTRDFNFVTDLFVSSTPLDFVRNAWLGAAADADAGVGANVEAGLGADACQRAYLARWIALNGEERMRICAVREEVRRRICADDVNSGTAALGAGGVASDPRDSFEGAYVGAMLELAPAGSCVFVANSMAVRALDTFYVKDGKPLCVLCNRGQNGIDGTTSAALGAAQSFAQTTYLTGDFTLLHDLNALALRHELAVHHATPDRSVVIVLLNNNGGAIFDMLPQSSDDPYFERLFLVPQDVRFEHAAQAFGVTYRHASTVGEFRAAYGQLLGVPGISLIEVNLPLRGVKERYRAYQQK